MNVEIGTVTVQFLFSNIFLRIFHIGSLQCAICLIFLWLSNYKQTYLLVSLKRRLRTVQGREAMDKTHKLYVYKTPLYS
jgi:hypothetical protein